MSERIVVSGDLEQITATVDGSAIHVVVSEVDGGGGGGADLSDALPAAPGTPAAGTDTEASRSDHVHAPPTPGQIGAATPGDVASAIAAASLDGGQIQSGFVPDVHIPASIARDSEVAAAVTAHTSAVDPHGDRAHADAAAAAVQAASQPVDSDLTAIAALSTTSFGRALLEQADAAALRTVAGLGTAATRNVGSGAGTVTAGDDSRLADARTPTAHVHTATDITSGTVSTARLGTGAANATTFLRGDGTWSAPVGQMTPTAPTGSWFQMTPGATYLGSAATVESTTAASNETATLWFLPLSAAVSINGMSFYCDTANAGIGARAALALWAADGPNGSPGTAISAPSANAPITTAGEKTPTWSTPVNLPAGGVWFALVPFGLDTAGVNPKFWGWNSVGVVQRFGWSATSPAGNNRTPRLQATATGGVPTSNPTLTTIASQGGFVPAVSVRVA